MFEELKPIVYLVDCQSRGGGNYKDAILDFRTESDFEYFAQKMGVSMSENSMLHLLNFHSSKRLRRGTHYRLNFNILSDELRVSLNENSPLFVGFSYDLRNLAENENGEVLETTWFPLGEITRTCEDGIDVLSNLPCCRWVNRKIRVNDVGQGNCNEILDSSGNVEIVYDLGASIRAPKTEVQKLLQKRLPCYKKSRPLLFISHWDLDHFAQLGVMGNAELKSFSGLVCSAKMVSLTSQKIYAKLKFSLGATKVLSLIPPKRQGKGRHRMLLYQRNCAFSIYRGQYSRNLNFCGIVLMAYGMEGAALLTGDCCYRQVDDILRSESRCRMEIENLSMVVPHHSGKFSRNLDLFHISKGFCGKTAIISVNAKKNSYGHPNTAVVQWLNRKFHKVKRTDCDGVVEENF